MSPTNPRPNRLREVREQAGLTQQQLADEVGAGRSTIIRAEQGTQLPTLTLADELAEALGTTIDELFSTSDRGTPDEAYWSGHRAANEERDALERRDHDLRGAGDEPEREERVEADTADPHGVAAFVSEFVFAKPSEPDHWQTQYLRNPRGTKSKLDAIIVVQVFRRPPRAAKRLYERLVNDLRGEYDTEADRG